MTDYADITEGINLHLEEKYFSPFFMFCLIGKTKTTVLYLYLAYSPTFSILVKNFCRQHFEIFFTVKYALIFHENCLLRREFE